ncbi:MAG TPA: AgmX/PglI C-terminal domain-containing protein, partial [Kofleriaceae bacterium]|nr:AgmX/PglI C-terminal domain-containing protein [Kofleriaceae bacterium]
SGERVGPVQAMSRAIWALALVAGCGGTAETSPGPEGAARAPATAAAPASSVPLRVELGECSGADARFVSGPPTPVVVAFGVRGAIGGGGGGGLGGGHGVPAVSIGEPGTTRDADKAVIRRVIRRVLPRVRYCYEKELLVASALAGTVTARFTITAAGEVTKSRAAGSNHTMAGCVASTIASLRFPATSSGGELNVSYPFIFRPADAKGTPQATKVPPDSSPEWVTPAPTKKEPPADGPVTSPDEGTFGLRGIASADEVVAPGDSPLRGSEEAIRACLAKQPARHGTLVLELAGGDGVTRIHGAGSAEAEACLVQVASGVAHPEGATAQRCSLAFGTVAAADAPGVDLAANAVAPAPVEGASGDRVVQGPLVVRADDATPMSRVNRVLETARVAGVPPALAARRDGAWTLLRAATLPEAPRTRRSGVVASDGPEVSLSILVHADGAISIGTTYGETARVGTGASRWSDVDRVLAEHRSAAFSGRTEVDVGGEDAARYGDLVQVIAAAARAGFTGWTVSEPERLSVRFTE